VSSGAVCPHCGGDVPIRRSRLTMPEVHAVLDLYRGGMKARDVAAKTGLARSHIYTLLRLWGVPTRYKTKPRKVAS